MANKGYSSLGDEIRESVQSAINKGDFTHLNTEIRGTVNQAIAEAKKGLEAGQNAMKEASYQYGKTAVKNTSVNKTVDEKKSATINNYQIYKPNQVTALPVRPVGKVGGVLFTVFGSILLGAGFLSFVILSSISVASGAAPMGYLAMTLGLPTVIAGTAMLAAGKVKSTRLARMNEYVKLTKEKGYCELKELAEKTGRKVRYIAKDIQKMIRMGMFPEGHLDEKQMTFILDSKTNQLYLEMMEARRLQSAGENSVGTGDSGMTGSRTGADGEGASEEKERAEVRSVVREGRDYIGQIRAANAAIPGEEISEKLDRLSLIMDKIFLYIEGHPEKLEELHKFMNYYLPTTLKLVNAYREFDAQPVQGENIQTAKREIEEILDTINEAFARLYDNLFAEAAMDISTDIDVLETMFAQEGLTEHKFNSQGGERHEG